MSESEGSIPVANPATTTSGLTDLTLAVRMEGVPEQEVFLQHGLSIGRNPSNTICVNEPEIERIHAMVAKQSDGSMLLECTDSHLVLTLADGSQVNSLVLRAGATFKLGKATIRCLKRETKPMVVVSENPWEVRCPRCYGVIADLPHQEHTCPHCQLELQYFVSHHSVHAADEPQSGAHDQTPAEPEFSGWLPRHVGPYKIRAFVAQGGMGIILRGLHTEADLPAAVKLLKSDPAEDPSWRARFMAEIDTLKTLRHPNVVHLQDSGKDDQLLWLAMDWIEGQPLTKVVANYRAAAKEFPIDELRQILAQVVTGLKYLHEKKLIHRDLKPSNVLMATDGLVKMVDFGIAKGAGGQTGIVTQLTQTGMVAGTESYMSPEQAEGQSVTPASDIYSLGVMWYELVTGRRPVGSFAAPHLARVECPISWSHTIIGCLATDPRARPALDRILQVLTTNLAEPPPLPGQRNRAPGAGGLPPAIPAGAPRANPAGNRTGSGTVPAQPAAGAVVPPPSKSAQPATGTTSAPPPPSHPNQPPRGGSREEVAQMATQVRPGARPPHQPPASDPQNRAVVSQMATQVSPARGGGYAGQQAGDVPPPVPPSKPNNPYAPAAPTGVQSYAPNPYANPGSGVIPASPAPNAAPGGGLIGWIKGHKIPVAIGAGIVLVIVIILMVRGCSKPTPSYTYTPPTYTPAPPQNTPAETPVANNTGRRVDSMAAVKYNAARMRFEAALTSPRPNDLVVAINEMTALAESGNTTAMLYLAQFYGGPRSGFYQDRNRAMVWANKAYYAGDPYAPATIQWLNAPR